MPVSAKGLTGGIYVGYKKVVDLRDWSLSRPGGEVMSQGYDVTALVVDYNEFFVEHGNNFVLKLDLSHGRWCWSNFEFYVPEVVNNKQIIMKVKEAPNVEE